MIEDRLVAIVDGIVMFRCCFICLKETALGLVRGVTDFFLKVLKDPKYPMST